MFWNKKAKIEDDGINFKWGSTYIKSDEVVNSIGGKYWKWNDDESITEFSPPELRMKTFIRCIRNVLCIEDFNVDSYTFKFNKEKDAISLVRDLDSEFWKNMEITLDKAEGKDVTINISPNIITNTYFPAKGPN